MSLLALNRHQRAQRQRLARSSSTPGWTRAQRKIWADAIVAGLHEGQKRASDAIETGQTKRITVQANRRSGKTEGIGRILGALAVARDGFVVRILTTNLEAPSETWLEREGDRGFLGMLDELGVPYRTTAIGGSARGIKAIRFPWGSSILVHDLAHLGAINRKRGFRAHAFWADEAQNLDQLGVILDQLVLPAAADFNAVIILSGTPGGQVGTLFHRASTGVDAAFCRIAYYCWDNPWFGQTTRIRWQRYLSAMGLDADRQRLGVDDDLWESVLELEHDELLAVAQQLVEALPEKLARIVKELPPDWLREHFGRWVEDGAEYVYPTHGIDPAVVYWANDAGAHPRERLPGLANLADIGERVRALPTDELRPGVLVRRDWRVAVAFDLGMNPDPFAWWAGAYCDEDPAIYEVWSGAENGLMDSAMLERVSDVLDGLRGAGLWIAAALVDAMGQRVGTLHDWSWRLADRFPEGAKGIIPPYKANEKLQIRAVNVDIQRGLLKALRGSPADIEARHLQWYKFDAAKPKEARVHKYRKVYLADGTEAIPGDHCMDCRRYVVWWVHHHGVEAKPKQAEIVPLTPEAQMQAVHARMRAGRR